jgi:hypothetical protein
MQSGSTGPVRPVVEEEPSPQAAGAVALGLVLLIVVLLVLGRDGAVEETTVASSVPATSTTITSTTAATTATTRAATTTTGPPSAVGLEALSGFQAGPVPPAAVCPPGSTPDTPGEVTAPRPFGAFDATAFDRESGLLVASVGGATWVFDPCRNLWEEMAAEGAYLGNGRMVYDADSDLIVALGDTWGGAGVWAYDVDTDAWTRKADPPARSGGFWPLVYHDPSGLVVARGDSGRTIVAYDVDTDSWYELGPMAPGLLAYDPGRDGFYLHRPGGELPEWWYQPGEGWTQLGIPREDMPLPGGAIPAGGVAFDEASGRLVVFSRGAVAALDPAVPGWEILDDHSDQTGAINRAGHSVVYDTANGRLIVLGGEYLAADSSRAEAATDVWAFDTRTRLWSQLLPAAIPEIVFDSTSTEAASWDWIGPPLAVSAREVWTFGWAAMGEIGHLKDGVWTDWRLTAYGGVQQLAVAPNGTVWAATDIGGFSFDGEDWTRRFDSPVGSFGVGQDGTVWTCGWLDTHHHPWLARYDGESWLRVDPYPEEQPSDYSYCWLAALPDGEVWIDVQEWWSVWLGRYDGATWEEIQMIGDYPTTGDRSIMVAAFEGAPNGDLWISGWVPDTDAWVLARFDGNAWTVHDQPSLGVAGMAVGPDGTAWLAVEDGLISFDGTDWTYRIQGQWVLVSGVDVAPDGTVWYTDDQGVHALP